MAAVNDPSITELGEGWFLTQLADKAGLYYRITGPRGEISYVEDEYMARMQATRLGAPG